MPADHAQTQQNLASLLDMNRCHEYLSSGCIAIGTLRSEEKCFSSSVSQVLVPTWAVLNGTQKTVGIHVLLNCQSVLTCFRYVFIQFVNVFFCTLSCSSEDKEE